MVMHRKIIYCISVAEFLNIMLILRYNCEELEHTTYSVTAIQHHRLVPGPHPAFFNVFDSQEKQLSRKCWVWPGDEAKPRVTTHAAS